MSRFSWLNGVYELDMNGQTSAASEILLIDQIDRLILDGRFEDCDAALMSIDFSRLSAQPIFGVLSVVVDVRGKLTCCEELLDRVENRFAELGREPPPKWKLLLRA